MEQSIFSRSVTILKSFTAAKTNEMQVIYEPGLTSPWETLATNRYYGFITDLRLKVDINSISEHALPALEELATRNEQITAIRDLEWRSMRKEIALYLDTSRHGLTHIASISLLNRLPYYHVNLMPYFTDNAIINLGNDARMLGQIIDCGYGLLENNDSVVVFGSVKEEYTTLPEERREVQYCQPFSWTVGVTSSQLLPTNRNRLQATFVNWHPSARIYINYGSLAEINKGICLMPGGGSYEINSANPYLGMVSAISSEAGATLSGLECL